MTQSYRRSLVTALLLACVPLLVVSSILYFPVTSRIERAALAVHEVGQRNTRNAVAAEIEKMETIALQWAMDKDIDLLRSATGGARAFQLQRELYQSLTTVSSLSPLIEEALVYLQDHPSSVYSENGVYHLQERETVQRCMTMLSSLERIQWAYDLLDRQNRVSPGIAPDLLYESVFLVVKLPALSLESTGLLLFRLNDRELARLFSDGSHRAAVALGPTGRVVALDRVRAAQPESPVHALYNIVSNMANAAAPHERDAVQTITLGGAPHGLFSYPLPVEGWRYYAAVSLSQIVSPVRRMSTIILLLAVSALFLAAGVSIFASRRLYRPVKKLLGEFTEGEELQGDDELDYIVEKWKRTIGRSNELQHQLAESRDELRSAFMLQYVHGYYHRLSDAEVRGKLSHVGFSIDERGLALTMVQLLSPGVAAFGEDEQEVLSLTAMSVLQSVLGDRHAHVYNFRNMTLGVLDTFALELKDHEAKTEQSFLAKRLMDSLTSRMSLRVIVSIGRPIRDAAELPDAFVAVRQSLTHRAVEPTSQIIDTDDVLPKGDYSAPYPFDVEREILNAMQMGWSDDAREGLRRFFNEVAMTGDRAFLVVESARQLLGNVLNTVLKSGFSPLVVFEGRDLYDELAELREVVHFERWFAERVVGPYITAIRSVQDLQSRRLVQQALELIHREYASPLFSLEWVAGELSSYPQKISSAFKEITGTNFVAYLTRHRLARAEELLKTTELPVSTVAERVGYQPSYFNRIFKKHQGVTPGEFRNDHARGEKARPAGREASWNGKWHS